MENIGSTLIASAYTSVFPLFNAAAAVCSVNGQNAPCTEGILAFAVAIFGAIWIVCSIVGIILAVSLWKLYTKAGKPGWASLIPVYNTIVMLEMIGKPIWWIFLTFIPVVNLVISIMIVIDVVKAFGKGTGFAFGVIFLPFIFIPILAFGNAVYSDPSGASANSGSTPPMPPTPAPTPTWNPPVTPSAPQA